MKLRSSNKNSATSAPSARARLTDRIRLARARAGFSKGELARRVGVSASAVVQWERPCGTAPNTMNLSAIAQSTGVAFEWLATGRGPTRVAASDGALAIELGAMAVTLFEERLLDIARKLPRHRHDALIEFLDAWTRKK